MAAVAADKARWFMEQTVPELQIFKEKGIFSSAEISAIATKRSAFEHRINMAGAASPADYIKYAKYEIDLDSQRKKRCLRLGVKGSSFAGQKRVFGVFERGVKKFPSDLGLLMAYLEFCKGESANCKLVKALTRALRLHPTKWELWAWAAKYYFHEQGDMSLARTYMQRGMRFCEGDLEIWVQYLRLEMLYVAKVDARRKILKLDESTEDAKEPETAKGFLEADEIALPVVTAAEMESGEQKSPSIDDATIKNLSATPALSGAVPLAIIDAARKRFSGNNVALEHLFDCVAAFKIAPLVPKLLDRLTVSMSEHPSRPSQTAILEICRSRAECASIDVNTSKFVQAFQRALAIFQRISEADAEAKWIAGSRMLLLALPHLDDSSSLVEEVKQLLNAVVRKYIEYTLAAAQQLPKGQKLMAEYVRKLREAGVRRPTLKEYGISTASDNG